MLGQGVTQFVNLVPYVVGVIETKTLYRTNWFLSTSEAEFSITRP